MTKIEIIEKLDNFSLMQLLKTLLGYMHFQNIREDGDDGQFDEQV